MRTKSRPKRRVFSLRISLSNFVCSHITDPMFRLWLPYKGFQSSDTLGLKCVFLIDKVHVFPHYGPYVSPLSVYNTKSTCLALFRFQSDQVSFVTARPATRCLSPLSNRITHREFFKEIFEKTKTHKSIWLEISHHPLFTFPTLYPLCYPHLYVLGVSWFRKMLYSRGFQPASV